MICITYTQVEQRINFFLLNILRNILIIEFLQIKKFVTEMCF